MTNKEVAEKVLAKLKIRPDMQYINDDYMNATIQDAFNDVYIYINARSDDDITESLITPICDICVISINLTGNEGLTASGKAGTSESYITSIPKPIRRKLQKYRRLP